MANRAHSGIRGVPWHICDRCACDTPTDKLVKQEGLFLCTLNGCLDNLELKRRDQTIQYQLNDQPIEMEVADILKEQTLGDDENLNDFS